MEPNTKWIWKKGENGENTWMCFVKKVRLEEAPREAMAQIAVDSKYWLYLNGELAVFEGGVKRGPDRNSLYYDELDLAGRLQKGDNTIAILVCYFGKDGFSHLDSKKGGLLFECDIDGRRIFSDGSWKMKKHPAYVEADPADEKSNFRLAESNIYFDATRDMPGWYLPDFDTSNWEQADEVDEVAEEVRGKLHKRDIPQLKDHGFKDYLNSGEVVGIRTTEKTSFRMRLVYNAQITPILKVTAPAGKRICIKADNYEDALYDTRSVMAVYYTKEGYQEYESLGWMNGEYIYYELDEGITVNALGYRETGFDTEFAGAFACDDPFLNRLWDKAVRTLYITMRDNFMDCPDRERAQWWGDVNIEMQEMFYALDEKALSLYRKGVDTLAGWAKDTGYMMTVVPSGKDQFELPMQNLAGIWGFWYYYLYSGDVRVPERAYQVSKDYLMLFDLQDGLVVHRKGSWDWPDWGENFDIAPMENAWYDMALDSCRKMAKLLGNGSDERLFRERQEAIRGAFDRAFWKGSYYYDRTENGKPDDRANALAVLAGLAGPEKYPAIAEILTDTFNASPYMEKYVDDALCLMGRTEEAVNRIRNRYREMVEYDYSTLWEYWDRGGTLNHAWTGGPIITMSKFLAGVRPLEPGYLHFEVKPVLVDLSEINCKVPSAKGMIQVSIRREEKRCHMAVSVPGGSRALVWLPVREGDDLSDLRPGYELVEGYARYDLTEGSYQL